MQKQLDYGPRELSDEPSLFENSPRQSLRLGSFFFAQCRAKLAEPCVISSLPQQRPIKMKKWTLLLLGSALSSSLIAQNFGQGFGFRGIVPRQEKVIELNEVVVESGTLGGATYNETSCSVTVLRRNEIQELPVQTLNELLDYVAALDVRQRGPLDVQADLGIRGGTFDQSLILVNGVRMNNPQTGHHNMNLPVPLSTIDRIEIIHGGSAAAQGIGAMTGVVNIILKEAPRKLNFGFGLTSGENGLLANTLYAGKRVGPWGVQFSQEHGQSAGYRPHTDFTSDKWLLSASRALDGRFSKGQVQVLYGENSKAFGASNFYSVNFPDQFEATRTRMFGVNLKQPLGELYTLRWNTSLVGGSDRFELYRESEGVAGFDATALRYDRLPSGRYYRAFDQDTALSFYSGPNFHRSTAWNNDVRLTRTLDQHKTTLALLQRYDLIRSNALGEPASPVVVPRWEDFSMDKRGTRTNHALLVEQQYHSERLMVAGGMMLNLHRGIDSAWAPFFAPSLSVSYRLTPQASLFANSGRSVRYPTYTDLYYRLGNAQGSTALRPESAWSSEVGYKWGLNGVYATAALFHRRSNDLIDWVNYPNDPVAYASNITRFRMSGIEGSVRYFAQKRKAAWPSAAASLSWMNGTRPEGNFASLYALDYLRTKFNVRATQRLGWGLFASYSATVQDRAGTFMQAGEGETPYAPFALLDVKVYYSPAKGLFKRQFPFQAFVQVNNALDTYYFDRGNIPQPMSRTWASSAPSRADSMRTESVWFVRRGAVPPPAATAAGEGTTKEREATSSTRSSPGGAPPGDSSRVAVLSWS